MTTENEKSLMFKFLERNYPVSRIKNNGRFKRGIILDNGSQHILSSTSHNKELKENLAQVLIKVFSCNIETARAILSNFLNLK